jgi:hypothetical protein
MNIGWIIFSSVCFFVGFMLGKFLTWWDVIRMLREKANTGFRLAAGGKLYEIKEDR